MVNTLISLLYSLPLILNRAGAWGWAGATRQEQQLSLEQEQGYAAVLGLLRFLPLAPFFVVQMWWRVPEAAGPLVAWCRFGVVLRCPAWAPFSSARWGGGVTVAGCQLPTPSLKDGAKIWQRSSRAGVRAGASRSNYCCGQHQFTLGKVKWLLLNAGVDSENWKQTETINWAYSCTSRCSRVSLRWGEKPQNCTACMAGVRMGRKCLVFLSSAVVHFTVAALWFHAVFHWVRHFPGQAQDNKTQDNLTQAC